MGLRLDELETEALSLPEKDRAHLFSRLLLSFEPASEEKEAAHVWAEEAERRDQAMESGEEPGIPAEEVFTKLRAALR
jgi:putative addiction module component (TIGR02574 family)